MLRSIGKQSRESVDSVLKNPEEEEEEEEEAIRWGGIAEKEGFKPGVKEWESDGRWEWRVDRRGSASDRNRWAVIPVLETGMTVDEEKLVVDSSDHVQHTEAYWNTHGHK